MFLCMQVLETCVKNCYPQFHTFLATSELWTDLLKMATDTGVVRVSLDENFLMHECVR